MRFSPGILPVLILALPCACFAAPPGVHAAPAGSASEHFLLDHNRIFVELTFVPPGGKPRRALAMVDSADPVFRLTTALVEGPQTKQIKATRVFFGGKPLDTSAVRNVDVFRGFYQGVYMVPGLPVEAKLPATVLKKYDVVLDYGKRTLTLAPPKSLKHEGVRVPCRVDRTTGLISVQAEVAGKRYAFSVDNGAAYTWIARSIAKSWVRVHPQWLRGMGAVGNANMDGSYPEQTGMILRLPGIGLGELSLREVGALGVGPGYVKTVPNFFAWYSEKTPVPVVGDLGGNVLRRYRLEIDYADGATYWKRERSPRSDHLDQVGIMIRPTPGGKHSLPQYFVVRVATQEGKKTVEGVEAGDRLISVDGMAVIDKTMGQVLEALHGKPGATRTLVLERRGKRIVVNASVTSF